MDTEEPERKEGSFDRENVGRTRKETVQFASYKAPSSPRLVAILLMRLDLYARLFTVTTFRNS